MTWWDQQQSNLPEGWAAPAQDNAQSGAWDSAYTSFPTAQEQRAQYGAQQPAANPIDFLQKTYGGGDQSLLSKVPTWNLNDAGAEDAIKAYTNVADSGFDSTGWGAFLRTGPTANNTPGADGGVTYDAGSLDAFNQLARAAGISTQGPWAAGSGGDYANMNYTSEALNEALKNYRIITGMTPDPNDDERNTYETVYYNDNGQLRPIWARERLDPREGGWLKSESGGSFLQAMMMAAPAIGAVAAPAAQAAGLTGGAQGMIGRAADAVGLGAQWAGLPQFAQGAISGAAQGGLGSWVTGGNPLTGALLGGAGGATSGGLQDLGLSNTASGMGGKLVGELGGRYIQDQIKDEVMQGRQDILDGLYGEADRRGISRQQLEQFLQTPQGRSAAQALISRQGPGSLQQLFG